MHLFPFNGTSPFEGEETNVAITEQSRHRVHQYFEEIMGQERADVVMEFLPTHDWADLATKHDLEDLRLATKHDIECLRLATQHDIECLNLVMKAEFAAVRQEMADLRAELNRDMRNVVLAVVGTNITLLGLAVAFLKLT